MKPGRYLIGASLAVFALVATFPLCTTSNEVVHTIPSMTVSATAGVGGQAVFMDWQDELLEEGDASTAVPTEPVEVSESIPEDESDVDASDQ